MPMIFRVLLQLLLNWRLLINAGAKKSALRIRKDLINDSPEHDATQLCSDIPITITYLGVNLSDAQYMEIRIFIDYIFNVS